jgi:hypothetical protein
MKQMKDTCSKTADRIFTLAIPDSVWRVAEAEAIKNRRPVGPQIVLMLERATARARKAVGK